MNRSPLLLLLPLLAGCNVHSKNGANDDENVSIHADDNGHVKFNLPMAQGEVKIPTSMMHGGNVDIDGVKLMPGSKVTGFNVESHNNVSNVDMSFSAPASPDQVRSYFVDQFKKRGADVSLSDNSVTGKSKDGSPFTIQVRPAGSGSQGKIEILSKD